MKGFQGILLAISGIMFVVLSIVGIWISCKYGNSEEKIKVKKTLIEIFKILLTGFIIIVMLAFIGEIFNL